VLALVALIQTTAEFDIRFPAGSHPEALLKPYRGPPMTLGNAAAARVRLIVWCKACSHQAEPDAAEIGERYGAATTVPKWRERLVCSRCAAATPTWW
jgi:hypothetical protein